MNTYDYMTYIYIYMYVYVYVCVYDVHISDRRFFELQLFGGRPNDGNITSVLVFWLNHSFYK